MATATIATAPSATPPRKTASIKYPAPEAVKPLRCPIPARGMIPLGGFRPLVGMAGIDWGHHRHATDLTTPRPDYRSRAAGPDEATHRALTKNSQLGASRGRAVVAVPSYRAAGLIGRISQLAAAPATSPFARA